MTTFADRNGPTSHHHPLSTGHAHNLHYHLDQQLSFRPASESPPEFHSESPEYSLKLSSPASQMLYTPTAPQAMAAAGNGSTAAVSALAAAAASGSAPSPTTAFPFPPPGSPLFMSTFNSLLAHSQNPVAMAAALASHHQQQQQQGPGMPGPHAPPHLSPWLNPSIASFLANNKQLLDAQQKSSQTSDSLSVNSNSSTTADDNNNELIHHHHALQHPLHHHHPQHPGAHHQQSLTPPKHRSRNETMDCDMQSAPGNHLEMRNSLPLSAVAALASASSSAVPTPTSSTSSPSLSQLSSTSGPTLAGAGHPAAAHLQDGPFKSFMLNPFATGVPSPTFGPPTPLSAPLPSRPGHSVAASSPSPSPSSSGAPNNSSTYPFPLLYPSHPYFPPGSQPPPPATNGLPPFLLPPHGVKEEAGSESSSSSSPTDLTKSTQNGLKRKSPVSIEESSSLAGNAHLPSTSGPSSSISSSISSFRPPPEVLPGSSDPKASLSGSRKHRILKPPNINIQEFSPNSGPSPSSSTGLPHPPPPSFLNSPMFTPQFGPVPSSPFTFGLEHGIPLSAPPIPSQGQSGNAGRCFDFSGGSEQALGQQFASSKDLSAQGRRQFPAPISIMKENKSSSKKTGSVTFQVPAAPSNPSSNSDSKTGNGSKNRYWGSQYPNYQRGTEVLLGNGSLKPIEQLSMQDFAVEDENVRMQLAEIANVIEKKKDQVIRIGFIIGQNRFKYSVDMPLEHPFFVYQKGWSSFSPDVTRKRYGLKCGLLAKGDIVVTVTNKVNMKHPVSSGGSKARNGSTGSLSSGSLSSSTSSLNSTSGLGGKMAAGSSKANTGGHMAIPGHSREDDDDVEIDVENE